MHFPIWGGLVAPKGIPAEAKAALETACETAMNSEAFSGRMAELRMPVAFMGSSEFQAFVASEFAKNDELLAAAGLKK
jgi:tripartite-type tricarboxylate transporter receptor subunit TctC